MRFNCPPGWPPPPPGWSPSPGWKPDPSWPPPPAGWALWTEDDSPAGELHAFAREYLLVGIAEQDFHRLMLGYAELAGPIDGTPFIRRRESLRDLVESRLTAYAPKLAGKPEEAHALSRTMLDILSGAAVSLEPYGVVRPVAYAAMVTDWLLDQATRS